MNPPFAESPQQYNSELLDMPPATNEAMSPTPITTFSLFVQPPIPHPVAFPPAGVLSSPSHPVQLPPMHILDHLLVLFFEKVPFGDRLVHRQSFMASLGQPSNSPYYPSASLLHTMCAIASIYSPAIELQVRRESPNRSWFEYFTHPDEIKLETGEAGGGGHGGTFGGTFGVEQASIGRVLALFDLRTGKRVFDTIRSMICLIWYYVSAAAPFLFLHMQLTSSCAMGRIFFRMQLVCELTPNSRDELTANILSQT